MVCYLSRHSGKRWFNIATIRDGVHISINFVRFIDDGKITVWQVVEEKIVL